MIETVWDKQDCPYVVWLKCYQALGNKAFYDAQIAGEYANLSICGPCKLHVVGHGPWCEAGLIILPINF